MSKAQIRILIIEDDLTSGQSLAEAIRRWGYTVDLIRNPKDVDRQIKLHEYHLAIIDALLPVTNGVEVGLRIHQDTQGTTRVLFISGIFKDRTFIKDALTKVPAVGFLTKPLNLEEVQSIIENQTKEFLPDAKAPLQALLTSESISNQIKIEALNNSETLHSNELPWVYALLVNSNLSGTLTLTPFEDVSPWTVKFSQGRIISIENNDTQSFFGQLLIEHGYLTREKLEPYLKDESTRRLGQRLVDAQLINSHITRVIQTEQLNIRLSQSITPVQYKPHFVQEEIQTADDNAHINKLQMTLILNDLLQSKVSFEWLKAADFWMEHCLEPAENFAQLEGLISYSY
ncbi:MAG: response regulator [Bdellovibrionales bacterium]